MDGDCPEAETGEGSDSGGVSIDILFAIFSDKRRQYVMKRLVDHDRAMALPDLAEDVASAENAPSRTEVPGSEGRHRTDVSKNRTQRITTSLHHVHLPKMADAGVVEYDPERNTVQASISANLVEHVLALAESSTGDGETS